MSKSGPKPIDLKEFLPYRLSIVTNKVSRNMGNLYNNKFDLSIAEWRIMAVLGQHRGLSADQVCTKTEMDKVSVSRSVTKLLNKKLVDRKFSDDDRRRSILQLSKSGYSVYTQIIPIALRFENQLLDVLSKQEQKQLNSLLDKLDNRARELSDLNPNL
jgi:DNA-binding MarR family transcriptional regulator